MSLFASPEEHASNPPESWCVVKRAERCWHLVTSAGLTLDRFTTRHAAESARTEGWIARLYRDEGRWYAGEPVNNWRSWAEVSRSS